MAACTTAEQPLTAPQAAGHHTAVDSILHCSVAAGSPGDPRAHRSHGAGSSQDIDAPRLAPAWIRHQAVYFVFSFVWKKAYMSNDANHISNPKDR